LLGYELADIVQHSNLAQDVTQHTLETLLFERRVKRVGAFWFAQAVWEALADEAIRLVSEQHRQYPLRVGLSKEEWRTRLHLPPKMATEILAALQEEGQLAEASGATSTIGSFIRLPNFVPTFTPAQQRQVEQLLHQFRANPYTPPGRAEAEAMVGAEVLVALIEQGRLVKLGGSGSSGQEANAVLFLRETYDEALAKLLTYLRDHGRITVAGARDVLETTRKYVLPLLEHMDERKMTRRVGDERILVNVGV
jgi:selenocysteine-specific elongation factor